MRIADRGVANKERLVVNVLTDANLSFYSVFATAYTDANSITTALRHTYWFVAHQVKAGDRVVLYTGSGQDRITKAKDGTPLHIFYWGLPKTIWNKRGDCAVLLEIAAWEASPYE